MPPEVSFAKSLAKSLSPFRYRLTPKHRLVCALRHPCGRKPTPSATRLSFLNVFDRSGERRGRQPTSTQTNSHRARLKFVSENNVSGGRTPNTGGGFFGVALQASHQVPWISGTTGVFSLSSRRTFQKKNSVPACGTLLASTTHRFLYRDNHPPTTNTSSGVKSFNPLETELSAKWKPGKGVVVV